MQVRVKISGLPFRVESNVWIHQSSCVQNDGLNNNVFSVDDMNARKGFILRNVVISDWQQSFIGMRRDVDIEEISDY